MIDVMIVLVLPVLVLALLAFPPARTCWKTVVVGAIFVSVLATAVVYRISSVRAEVFGPTATFFVTGAELAAHPELGRRILAGGHELGNHSWSHPRLIFKSSAALQAQVHDTDEQIRQVGQKDPIAFRPPYGKRLWGLHSVLGDRPAVLWDVEPESDSSLASDPEALARHVVDHARPGSIVLLHVMYGSRETTREALPMILVGLREKGLGVTTYGELLRSR